MMYVVFGLLLLGVVCWLAMIAAKLENIHKAIERANSIALERAYLDARQSAA